MQLGLHKSTLTPFDTERRSTLILGKPRTGKTTALTRLALDDIYAGRPVVFIGSDVSQVLRHIPKWRQHEVTYFSPSDFPIAFNILSGIRDGRHALFATTLLETVKGIWGYDKSPTPTLDQYIRAGIHSLLSVKGTTLLSLKHLITDKAYRTYITSQLHDPILTNFWADFEKLTDKEKRQDTASTINKIRAFFFEPLIRNCLDQHHNNVSFNGVLLVSLKDELGRENASLLGALILCCLYVSGQETHLYIDGGERYGTAILSALLSAPHIKSFLSIQYLDQLSKNFQPALIGSVGQVVAFRSSLRDAQELEPEFNLNRDHWHFHEMPPYRATVTIDGHPTELYMPEHGYHETDPTPIINRSKTLSAPIHSIEKRLGRFNGSTPSIHRRPRSSRRSMDMAEAVLVSES
jgi:hypothetical protein